MLFFSLYAVSALMAIKGSLVDPMNNLKNWNRGDPCTKNWTGVFCHDLGDTYLLVTELYDQYFYIIYLPYPHFQFGCHNRNYEC